MPRETFQQELDDLVEDVLDLGTEVEGSLGSMVKAMEGRDASLAEKELGVDVRYKARGAAIERDGMLLQARQAPVARDLRLQAATSISSRTPLASKNAWWTSSVTPVSTAPLGRESLLSPGR